MQRQNIGNQLTGFLKSGSMLSILIIVNVAVWVLSLLFPLVDYLYAHPSGYALDGWYGWLALSSEWEGLLLRPWTILTYMFLHNGFWHILFNMLMLYVGGIMFYRYLGTRRFGWVYLFGGIVGGLLYLLIYNMFPVGRLQYAQLMGASAAVLAVFVAVAVYVPNQELNLWLVVRSVPVKMRYLALAFIVIDLLSIPASNAGGHIAHRGGALFGWLYIVGMKTITETKIITKTKTKTKTGGRPLTDDEFNRRRANDQKRVDEILDKISQSGYEKLTREEKEFLFKYK